MSTRTTARRRATTALAAAAAATLPLVLGAVPAHAVSTSGCTVTPSTPTYSYTNTSGVKVLAHQINISCTSGNRTVWVDQQRWEEDGWPNPDDHIGSSSLSVFFASAGATTRTIYATLPDTESGQEEMYNKVRMRVSSNGVFSAWTGWQSSGTRSFFN